MNTILDAKQAQELSEVLEQTVQLVNKDRKDLVVVHIVEWNMFEAVPSHWCDEQYKGWKEIIRVCAG